MNGENEKTEANGFEELKEKFQNSIKNITENINKFFSQTKIEAKKPFFSGFPRIVDSLCPECNEVIKAKLYIDGKKVIMGKECEKHGKFKEILSDDKDFFLRMEKLYFGDSSGILNPQTQVEKGCPGDCGLCSEHKSTTMMGIIDLTNRCNLKCPICFATSDASGCIYEPSFKQVKEMMHTLYNLQPAHAPCLQFSGGEPTLHPKFFKIIKEAKKIGFTQIQIATNGITFANGLGKMSGEKFAKKASKAGLNLLYLQFDGISDDIYKKIRGKELFEIKKKAIKNAFKYGIRTILVPTLAKGCNDKELGNIYKFAIDNIDAISAISFQPVALTGRIPEKEKKKLRYTLTDLARDTEKQFPYIKMSDWYPLSFVAPFSRILEIITNKPMSQISCHAHCGTGTYLIVDTETGKHIPLPRFVDVIGAMTGFQEVYEREKGKFLRNLRFKLRAMQYLKEFEEFYDESKAPDNMPFKEFMKYLTSFTDTKNFSDNKRKKKILKKRKWRLLVVAGMHFQDSYNYETERTKRCVVHYATPDGKLYPFCSYNSGPYYRDKVERQFAKT